MADETAVGEGRGASAEPTLARTIGLGALILYGIGDMLGAGVYSTIGKVAEKMGTAIWAAFLASMCAALLTGLSYASLGSRYPRAAGVAYITHRAYRIKFLTYVCGLTVVASGLTSMATQSRAFSGYLLGLVGRSVPGVEGSLLPPASLGLFLAVLLGFILVLSFINFWGIQESVWLNILCTLVEVGGLLLIIAVGLPYLGKVNLMETPPLPGGDSGGLGLSLILQGAVLTFYSFVGFEDMINVAEEVKNPRRNFPIGVVCALAATTVIYILISVTVVSVLPWRELAASHQPLVDVVRRAAPWFPTVGFSVIALFAITNTALVNYIMGSRLVYGMARQGFVPRILGTVHPVRRTPHVAILSLMAIVTALALYGGIRDLASATSILLLTVFTVVNISLIVLKSRADEPKGAFEIPSIIPAAGAFVCLAILLNGLTSAPDYRAYIVAGVLLLVIGALFVIMHPREITEESLSHLSD